MANILICNDNQQVVRSLDNLLKGEGHEVQTANRALDAVRIALSERFHVLLLDLDIERGRGYYLIEVINALDDDIAVITLTQKDSLELQRLARQGKVFFHAIWPQDRDAISVAVKDAEALTAKKYAHEKGKFPALCPAYLQKRIGEYITRIRGEVVQPVPGKKARSTA